MFVYICAAAAFAEQVSYSFVGKKIIRLKKRERGDLAVRRLEKSPLCVCVH